MVPLKLQLQNFMSYRNLQVLDFQIFNLACLTGENGVGKSTLLEAITWAVWGQARGSKKFLDELIHQDETSMWVEFIFEHEKNTFRVLRRRIIKLKSAKTYLDFQIKNKGEWKNLTEATLESTQYKIIKTLRLPYDIFVNSSYLRQGHADEFTVKTPAERKEILSDILGLELFEILLEKTKNKKGNLETEAEKIKNFLGQVSEIISGKEEVKKNLISLEIEKKEKQKVIENLKLKSEQLEEFKRAAEVLDEKLRTERKNFEDIKLEIKNIELENKENLEKIERVKILLKNQKTILENFQKLQRLRKENEQYLLKFEKLSKLKEEWAVLYFQKEKVNFDVQKILKITVCPTCKRPLSELEAKKVIEHLKEEFEKKFAPKMNNLKKQIAQIGYSENLHQKVKSEISKLQYFENEKNKLDLAENDLKHLSFNLVKNKKEIGELYQKISRVKTNGLKLKKEREKLGGRISQFRKVSEDLENFQVEHNLLSQKLGGFSQKLKQIEEFEEKKKKEEAKLSEILGKIGILDELSFSFSKNGVPAMIISETLPAVEEESNRLLSEISEGKMSLRFETLRQKKTSEQQIETLDIIISDNLGERPYELFSGGEAFRINFAIRVAISKLLSRRAGAKLEFLVVDEGFGALDTAGREDIISAINSVRDEFKKILVITHIEDFKSAFENQILVSKDEKGSRIEMV